MFSFIENSLSLGTTYLYPSYCAYKALNKKDAIQAQEWLCYWIVLGVITFPLYISDTLLFW